ADALVQQVERLDGHVPDPARVLEPELCLDDFLVARQAVDRLAAIAPARTRADLARLEQDDVAPPFGQVQRGREACESAADDSDVATYRLGKRRVLLRAYSRRCVVRMAREVAIGLEETHKPYALGKPFEGSAQRPPGRRHPL